MPQVLFLHHQLILGGAERLILDAADELNRRSFVSRIVTCTRDASNTFPETLRGPLAQRISVFPVFPRRIFGRAAVLCSTIRMALLALIVAFLSIFLPRYRADVVFVDQVAACIPLCALIRSSSSSRRRPIVFYYCHFPDLLLTRNSRRSALGRLYRRPFDALERRAILRADAVGVNSRFTLEAFHSAFPDAAAHHCAPLVLYPPVALPGTPLSSDACPDRDCFDGWLRRPILSINRFEAKKDLPLALHAFSGLPPALRSDCTLVLAGGYTPRDQDNVAVMRALKDLAAELGLSHATYRPEQKKPAFPPDVLFVPAFSAAQKAQLLTRAAADGTVLYTPSREHFGIVPVEAMCAGAPVVASQSGGPAESVVDGVTGFLVDVDTTETADRTRASEEFAALFSRGVLTALSLSPHERREMREASARRVAECFSTSAFGEALANCLREKLMDGMMAELLRDAGRAKDRLD
jgi:alpha-1,3/alpha-1,6-mannosyltransferase